MKVEEITYFCGNHHNPSVAKACLTLWLSMAPPPPKPPEQPNLALSSPEIKWSIVRHFLETIL